ncbi:hypothetical protein E5676_scaffold313G00720 [Cucumis melo var. makuwa]|uniref:Uncharacterized protein n=1 Tax=Cucumis melo var. makuwa TaxID=1194695 RepID=A0A5A7UU90_CUCMM|nr:hypothetical protein E6C27_scaffold1991G00020 [Cucumis melo var. makuwa]TYK26500.1 hypothetical protein E5676_scaffold313G00720 [Cucumis melo var. makuwa]
MHRHCVQKTYSTPPQPRLHHSRSRTGSTSAPPRTAEAASDLLAPRPKLQTFLLHHGRLRTADGMVEESVMVAGDSIKLPSYVKNECNTQVLVMWFPQVIFYTSKEIGVLGMSGMSHEEVGLFLTFTDICSLRKMSSWIHSGFSKGLAHVDYMLNHFLKVTPFHGNYTSGIVAMAVMKRALDIDPTNLEVLIALGVHIANGIQFVNSIDTRSSYSQFELDEVQMKLVEFLGGHM